MISCINTRSSEFQSLLKETGLSEFNLESQIRAYQDKYGEWPHSNELNGANTIPYIKDQLKLNTDNATKVNNLLEFTGTTTILDAKHTINDQFRDQRTDILSLGEDPDSTIIVSQVQMPNLEPKDIDYIEQDTKINNPVFIDQLSEDLADTFGINIIPISNDTINSTKEFSQFPDIQSAKAFIYNGNIYINTNTATIDSPIHEMLHLLFGAIKYTDNQLYNNLVQTAQQFNSFDRIARNYPNRTMGDLCEEVFITELANHLVGKPSELNNLDKSTLHKINYNIYQTLDRVLMGDISAKAIPESDIYNMSLKEIATLVNSKAMKNNINLGFLNDSQINRICANKKSQLLKEDRLKEDCI